MLKDNQNALLDTVSRLVEVNLELFKIEIKEEVSDWAIRFSLIVVLLVVSNMVLVFSSFAIAFLLGTWLNNYFFGFGSVALFYLVLALILWANRLALQRKLKSYVHANLFEQPSTLTTTTTAEIPSPQPLT